MVSVEYSYDTVVPSVVSLTFLGNLRELFFEALGRLLMD